MLKTASTLLLAFSLAACGGEQPAAENAGDPAGATPQTGGAEATPAAGDAAALVISAPEVHDAMCGHALDEVGHCGNYVKLGGDWVEIKWPELGSMEWCSKGADGARVEITGEMKDGKFVAASYKQVD